MYGCALAVTNNPAKEVAVECKGSNVKLFYDSVDMSQISDDNTFQTSSHSPKKLHGRKRRQASPPSLDLRSGLREYMAEQTGSKLSALRREIVLHNDNVNDTIL